MSLPVKVLHGKADGPTMWLSAAIHGDEINGVEVIRRLMDLLDPRDLRGTVIAVPIVNVFGFMNGSRYLPDRRDLNRSFPGSPRGSLASRLADLFLTQIVDRCGFGIDFHTGAHHRTNLSQIRADLQDAPTRGVAEAFGAPIMIHAKLRDGSLRETAASRGAKVLLFEGGEPNRFSRQVIETGVDGTMRVLRYLDMWGDGPAKVDTQPMVSEKTLWVRARRSGILWLQVQIGDHVRKGQPLGTISDAFGEGAAHLTAPSDGVVIGTTRNPLTSQGDGLVHIALLDQQGSTPESS
ncbi:MAG: succinylglutamate desuccinylase/aspartoacylase family protein [Actinomycetota bacterium]